jgi:spoIIIJ-associated protein
MSGTDLASQPHPDAQPGDSETDATPAAGEQDAPGTEPAESDLAEETTTPSPKKVARAESVDLVHEGDVAADYLESLLDILDLDGDLDMDVEGERAVVAIVGKGLGSLVGDRGETLEALQELTRLAVQREMGVRSRLMLDIGGFRARRRAELASLGAEVAARVAASGGAERLAAMTPFERKVVHDAVAAVSGVYSESEGEEPKRRVVVLPD